MRRTLFSQCSLAGAVAGLCCGVADVLWNRSFLLVSRDVWENWTTAACVVAIDLACGVLVGGLVWLYARIGSLVQRRTGSASASKAARVAWFAIPLAAYVWAMSWASFSGAGLQRARLSIPLALSAGIVGTAGVLWLSARRWWTTVQAWPRWSGAVLLLCAVLGGWVDANLYRGLYTGIHRGLSACLAGMAFTGAWVLTRDIPSTRLGRATYPWLLAFASTLLSSAVILLDRGVHQRVVTETSWARRPLETFAYFRRTHRKVLSHSFRGDKGIGPQQLEYLHDVTGAALQSQGASSILLLTLDTVRPDHTTMFGYRRDTTPVLHTLSRKSLVFAHAYAPFPGTSYGIASLMTGLPIELVFHRTGRSAFPTLPRILSQAGYETFCHFAYVWLYERTPGTGYYGETDLGCDHFRRDFLPAPALSALGRQWIAEGSKEGRPVFVWLHFVEPHHPYDSHPEYGFGDKDVDRYDGEIRAVDSALGPLLEMAENRGFEVVVASDHGEEFGEHGHFQHQSDLFEEQVKILLMVHAHNFEPGLSKCLVSSINVFPTALQWAGLEPPQWIAARPLPRQPGCVAHPGVVLASLGDQLMLRLPRWKLVWRVSPGVFHVFRVRPDGSVDESENLVEGVGPVTQWLKQELLRYLDRMEQPIGQR